MVAPYDTGPSGLVKDRDVYSELLGARHLPPTFEHHPPGGDDQAERSIIENKPPSARCQTA